MSARILDTFEICEKTIKPKFLGFLSAEQAVFASKILENRKANFGFWGGCDSCERVMVGCFPQGFEKTTFPISAITFKFRKTDKLSHRDFLGTLMGLGITRESVGDILVEDGYFGDATDVAVRRFQQHVGLAQDGVVGAYTWISIFALANIIYEA